MASPDRDPRQEKLVRLAIAPFWPVSTSLVPAYNLLFNLLDKAPNPHRARNIATSGIQCAILATFTALSFSAEQPPPSVTAIGSYAVGVLAHYGLDFHPQTREYILSAILGVGIGSAIKHFATH